ncbi:MAG: hypothetical protein J6U37_03540 [Lachnospiraceae bacterium]|nr:hypothetical protein [Lachnospiraceae bacterium]
MAYRILFNTLKNKYARDLEEEFKAEGHEVISSDGTDNIDMLVLFLPEKESLNAGKSIRDELDFRALSEEISDAVSNLPEYVKENIGRFKKDGLKRIAFITDKQASIRESLEETDFSYHCAQAATTMMMKILFNTYRPEGFTFRCFAAGEGGMGAAEYLLTDQSYIKEDDYIHSDENRLVMRNGMLREITW